MDGLTPKLYRALRRLEGLQSRRTIECRKCGQSYTRRCFALKPAVAEGLDPYCRGCRERAHAQELAARLREAEYKRSQRLKAYRRSRKPVRAAREPRTYPLVMPCRVLMCAGRWMVPPAERPLRYVCH